MENMNIPERAASNTEFAPMETAYHIYEADPTIANAAAFINEAGKIYDLPGVGQYTTDPRSAMSTAMEADFNVRVRGMMDEAYAAGEGLMSAGEFAQAKGVPVSMTDADAEAGMTMKMDGEGNGGYNGEKGGADVFKPTPELENHIMSVDSSVPRSRGIGGAHNSEEFFKNDVNIVKAVPSKDIPGVTYYEYTMPLLGKDGKPIGGYGKTIYYKTVYDPMIFPHEEYIRRGLEAAKNSYTVNGILGSLWEGYDSQGVKWIGYGRNGKPTSFFPDVTAY